MEWARKIVWRSELLARKLTGSLTGVSWVCLLRQVARPQSHYPDSQILQLAELVADLGKVELFRTGTGDYYIPKPGKEVLAYTIEAVFRETWYSSHDVSIAAGDVVIDCGAHVGVFSRFALARGAERVVSIEMDDLNFSCLERNLEREPRSLAIHAALGEHKGAAGFFPNSTSNSHRLGPIDGAPERKQTITLDEIVGQLSLSRVDFIKLNVEGAETDVLAGALQTLRSNRPKLAIEVYRNSAEEKRVRSFLKSSGLGYTILYGPFHRVSDLPPTLLAKPA